MKYLLLFTILITLKLLSNAQTVTDIDGNVYNTVTIGTQTWMVENLKTTKYRNGDLIGTTTPATLDISSETAPKYQWERGNRLYTWYAATDSRNVCPSGWHVPSSSEFDQLTDYSGFTGLSEGERNSQGQFFGSGVYGTWWSSTEQSTGMASAKIKYEGSNVSLYSGIKSYGLSVRCLMGEGTTIPVLTTLTVTDITSVSATCGGNVTNDGGSAVTARGVCWSTNPTPTVFGSKTVNGTGTGTYTSAISTIFPNKTYYIRAYATNEAGTGYGNILSFKTLEGTLDGTVTDIDGNVYKTATIGTQVWMAENLKTTKFSNGDIIPTTSTPHQNIMAEIEPKYQWPYEGNETYVSTRGRLYNWFTVIDSRNLCPTGYHIPNKDEWNILINYLGGGDNAGGKIKDTSLWANPNSCANNETGFTAIPGGYRTTNIFGQLNEVGYWWSSTIGGDEDTYYFGSYYANCSLIAYKRDVYYQNDAYSVRCVKNNISTYSNSVNSEEITFYPNPATDKLHFKNVYHSNTIITIFDLQGIQILNKQIDTSPIDISNIKDGIYIIKLVDSENVLIGKFIKE